MSTGRPLRLREERRRDAEVVTGLDPHKDVLVAVAVDGNGRQIDVKDATVRPRGCRAQLRWARILGSHWWPVEDVRHVAGGLVRFLLAEGEHVVWVAHPYERRLSATDPAIGRSDPIDTLACARAALAMFTGYAPISASSGNSQRVRLNRGGNRRMNAAIHRIAITPKRMHQPAQDYLATRRALGNSNTEAIGALKRHIARRVFALVQGGANAGRMTALTAKPAEPIAAWRLSVASLTHGLDRGGALRHSRSAPCARASALGARSSRR